MKSSETAKKLNKPDQLTGGVRERETMNCAYSRECDLVGHLMAYTYQSVLEI